MSEKTQNNQFSTGCVNNNSQVSPSIFKLVVDCFEELFEYLSIGDLINFGATCKRMQKVAGHLLKENYAEAQAIYTKDGLFIYQKRADNFGQVLQSVAVTDVFGRRLDQSNYINLNKFKLLRRIEFHNIDLNFADIECMKDIMGNVEYLVLNNCQVEGQLGESLFGSCGNLKRLFVYKQGGILENPDNTWLTNLHPKLEHIEFAPYNRWLKMIELKPFLERNSNIRRLAIDSRCFLDNLSVLMNTNAQLDDLAINLYHGLTELGPFCDALNKLHEKGFYKKLHFYVPNIVDNANVKVMASLKALVKLYLSMPTENNDLSVLKQLEELCIVFSLNGVDLEKLQSNTQIKRLFFLEACFDDILQFTSLLPKLERIRFSRLYVKDQDGRYELETILDLTMLNKQRAKLANARKLKIYVDESVYLATKWVNADLNLDFVELRRIESYDWMQDFHYGHCSIRT